MSDRADDMTAILKMGILKGKLKIKDRVPYLYLPVIEKLNSVMTAREADALTPPLKKLKFCYSRMLDNKTIEYEFEEIE